MSWLSVLGDQALHSIPKSLLLLVLATSLLLLVRATSLLLLVLAASLRRILPPPCLQTATAEERTALRVRLFDGWRDPGSARRVNRHVEQRLSAALTNTAVTACYRVRKGNARQLGPDFSTKEQMSRRCSGGGMWRWPTSKKKVFEFDTPGSVLEVGNPKTLEESTVLALNFTICARPKRRISAVLNTHFFQETRELFWHKLRTIIRMYADRYTMTGKMRVKTRHNCFWRSWTQYINFKITAVVVDSYEQELTSGQWSQQIGSKMLPGSLRKRSGLDRRLRRRGLANNLTAVTRSALSLCICIDTRPPNFGLKAFFRFDNALVTFMSKVDDVALQTLR